MIPDHNGEKDNFKKDGKIEVTFDGLTPVAANEDDAKVLKQLKTYFGQNMVKTIDEIKEGATYYSAMGVEVKTQYYVDPFGFSMEGSGKYEKAGEGSGSVSCDMYIRFNEYGWIDLLEVEFEAEGKSTYEGVTYTSSEKSNIEFSVEYK